MVVNADKPQRWKVDIARSVDYYNKWFLRFAPRAYRETREKTAKQVEAVLRWANNLRDISHNMLREHPEVLQMLRMATAPPLARDRLVGLAGVSKNLVKNMEDHGRVSPRLEKRRADRELRAIGRMIVRLADRDIFPWLEGGTEPEQQDVYRASTIVADRLCGAVANPIIRNAQERRQLAAIRRWLERRGYSYAKPGTGPTPQEMRPGTFSFRLNVPVALKGKRRVNVPVDVAVKPVRARDRDMPLLVEAKSAGDFTNTNKRRKEEATKVNQLRDAYGDEVTYVLLLCGYFDSGYLGYEAAEGIDWVWEHRIGDLAEFAL